MPELAEYELDDGTTMQLTDEDAKKFPGARKVGGGKAQPKEPKQEPKQDQPVHNRARR